MDRIGFNFTVHVHNWRIALSRCKWTRPIFKSGTYLKNSDSECSLVICKSSRGVLFPWVTFGDPYGGQGVERAAWGSFKHCSGHKELSPCQFSAKSSRGAFPHTFSAMSFLSVRGTGLPVERMFSNRTDLIPPKRRSMKAETTQMCMCLRGWIKSKNETEFRNLVNE